MKISKVCVLVSSLITAGFLSAPAFAADKNPLSGYTIHVVAPHVMDGEIIGPFHHYCKPINDDVIQCILFESAEPNARYDRSRIHGFQKSDWIGHTEMVTYAKLARSQARDRNRSRCHSESN